MNEKVPWPVKIGLSFGSLCESTTYYLFYTYFLYYLTNIAGINPAVAGIICSVAVVWDGVIDPFIGYLSDNSKNPKGRRIPLIKNGAIGLGIAMIMLFFPHNLTGVSQIIYYVFMVILYWTCYSFIVIPWTALGSELTDNYGERNKILMTICIFALPFIAVANSGPMWVQEWLKPIGYTEAQCWLVTAVFGAVLVVAGAIIVNISCKGREAAHKTKDDLTETMTLNGVMKTYANLLKLKQYRIILINGLFFMAACTLCTVMIVYVLKYNVGMDEGEIGTFWIIFSVFTAVGAPFISWFANRTDKKTSYIMFCAIMTICYIVYYFTGMRTPMHAYVFAALFSFGAAGFWIMYYSMLADNTLLYEFVYGKKREGAITSLSSFAITTGGAFATFIAGSLLEFVGYRADGPMTESVLKGILGTATLVPAGMLVIAIISLSGYKLNKKEFNALKIALELKRQNEEYSTELFAKAL